MAKCNRCGKKGLFLKLTSGFCDNCLATIQVEIQQANLKENIAQLQIELADQHALYAKIEETAKATALEKALQEEAALSAKIEQLKAACLDAQKHLDVLLIEQDKAQKNVASTTRKIQRGRELARAVANACDEFDTSERIYGIRSIIENIDDYLTPTVKLSLQCMDMRELRKRYKENEKNIQATFDKYQGRYTTKANIAIYRLMVIALSAELQNILHDIGYGKLDDALADVKAVTDKYYAIATDGNQNIAPTLKKFIGELDYFFQEAVRIEYEYYVQKERAREEQRAIREQMRQEAEERKELERQQKKIEKEEAKFQEQIDQLTAQVSTASDDEISRQLRERIEQLQQQLSNVAAEKERIIHLQNGKAGNVYVISNLGSFGENVFKIGMTRRAEPMDRVRELGDASVPFPFDVHSMIFSDDAVALETHLHHTLNDKRVNKVNLRKEFFNINLDELEQLVTEICPTAEFKRTMLAEQYRQSLSINHVDIDSIPQNDLNDDLE